MDRVPSYLEGKAVTAREVQILSCWSKGMTRKETGEHLYITECTVKTHAAKIFRKLGANNQAHAVAIAFRRDLIE